MIVTLILLCWLLMTAPAGAADTPEPSPLRSALDSLSSARMMADVTRLSAADYNGRQTGTADDLLSASLIAERLHSLGLHPRGTDSLTTEETRVVPPGRWAQSDPVTVSQLTGRMRLEVSGGGRTASTQPGTDFLPILDSPSVDVTAPILFVGYGLSDPSRGVDDYVGLDARGKIVLFLRGKPEGYDGPSGLTDKVRAAREKGAVAFLTVTGPVLSPYEARRGMTVAPMAAYGADPLPGAWITPDLADVALAAGGRTLRQLQERLNQRAGPQSLTTGAVARLAWERSQSRGPMVNVVGALPGQDSRKASEAVLIGAHRDHFGRHGGLLFPGADDNASGTAVLLETARVLAASRIKPKRTVLFVSFSGEEQGLLGSRLYVNRPVLPLDRLAAMINVDHAGVGNGRLTVGVTGLARERAADAGRLAGLSDLLDLFGFFPGGDHVPFKEAGVPTVTVVSGGPHPHFHQPADRAETVQPQILEKAARYVLALTWLLADAE
jgi:hypothetical protein